ncbi:MAG: polymorphic toxin-type HINT domain-containing protein, partial [Planctomycetota bacterium]
RVLSGEIDRKDTFTETETSNSETGNFERETDVEGEVTGTRTVNGSTTAFTEAVDQVVTQDGNYVDGDIDMTVTGDGRYDALVEHTDTSNAATSTTGNLDYSPTGVPMLMGAPPTLPTAGGTEGLAAVQAAAVASYAVSATGSLSGAAFRGPQASLVNSIVPGSSLSGSAMQQQYAMLGTNAIEQYCFPAGTEILMADGDAKRIEEIETGDIVASANVATEALIAASADGMTEAERPTLQAGTVSETYHNGPQQLLHVHLGDSSIPTTDGHPFFVVTENEDRDAENGRWVLARDLSPGDRLTTATGDILTVTAITRDQGPAVPVFNFCVEEHHNYHVRLPGTDHFVLVHNDSFGLYTYGHALVPVVIEAINDWVSDIADQAQAMIDWISENTLIDEFFSAVIDVGIGIANFVTDVINVGVGIVGGVVSLVNQDLGESIINTAIQGIRDNTLFGVSSVNIAIAGLSAVATIATFGTAGAVILFAGAAFGVADAYIRADLGGKTFTFNAAFEGMINGITNPFGVSFGVVGGAIAVANHGPGSRADILKAYEYGNRAGTALGTIVGGLAMTGRAAYLRSGSMGYAMKAMAPGAIGGVGGFAYGQMTGRDFATSMEIASVTSMVMDLGSALFIKCFVAGTPVWVPVQGDAETWAAVSQPGTLAGAGTSNAELAAGISLAVLTSVAFAALIKPRDEEEELDDEARQRAGVDSVFGISDESWKDLADVMWSEPHGDWNQRRRLRFGN